MFKVLIITGAFFGPVAKTLDDIAELKDKNIDVTVRLHKSSDSSLVKKHIRKLGMRACLDSSTDLHRQMREADLNVSIAYRGLSTVVLEGLLLKAATIAYFPVGEEKFSTDLPDYCYAPVKTKKAFQTILKDGSRYYRDRHQGIDRAKALAKRKMSRCLSGVRIVLMAAALPLVLIGIVIKRGLERII